MSHLSDTVRGLEKERETHAAEIKRMRGTFFQHITAAFTIKVTKLLIALPLSLKKDHSHLNFYLAHVTIPSVLFGV